MREKQAWLADAEILYRFLSDAPEPPRQADLILALGSHDRRVPDYAAAVYHSGAAPLLVCTGGLGRMTRDLWTEPEAVIFSRRCRELDVPAERILTEPENALIKQYQVLLATEGVDLEFQPEALSRIAELAETVNETAEDIGARRLHTLLEKLLEEISFSAPDLEDKHVVIDAAYVDEKLKDIAVDRDLSQFIL